MKRNILIIGITILSLALRLYNIIGKELWYDEVLDVLQSQKPVLEILNDVKLTPLHYLFAHAFSIFSTNIVVLRIPSIVFGILSILVLYQLVKKIASKNVALFTAFLLAISPMAIEFSQQILHYSSFIFFTLVSLYFYLDLITGKEFKVKAILFFLFFTICNLASHISAFIIIAVEGFFFVCFYLFQFKEFSRKFKLLISKKMGLALVTLMILSFVLLLSKTDYVNVMHRFTTFNVQQPIKIGYSLSHQLQTEYITRPSIQFFLAMFAWFSLGTGFRLYFYLFFFGIGLLSLVRKPRILAFILTWIFFPFLLLFVVRIDHWFEEKYLIFILPISLMVIGTGVIATLRFWIKKWKKIYLSVLITVFFLLSLKPISTRTTYGFSINNEAGYNWQKLYLQIPRNDESAIFSLDELYSKVYLGETGRNKKWYTDEYLSETTPEEYQLLVGSPRHFYYASIPDLINLRAGNLVQQEKVGLFGNINLYKIKFLKTSPIKFSSFFADDFIKLDYLKNASNWSNVRISFRDFILYDNEFVSGYQPLFLVPTSKEKSFVSYKFTFNTKQQHLYLKMGYVSKSKEEKIQIIVESPIRKQVLTNPISQEVSNEYTEEVYDLSEFKNSPELEITFSFLPQVLDNEHFDFGLKYFSLYENQNRPTELLKTEEGYKYNSMLEADQKVIWLQDTVSNFGWWQTSEGTLYKSLSSDNPLVYKFELPKNIKSGKMIIDSFTMNNGLDFSISNDGKNFDSVASIVDQKKYLTHEFSLDKKYIEGQSNLYIKVDSKEPNPQAVLRNIKLVIQ